MLTVLTQIAGFYSQMETAGLDPARIGSAQVDLVEPSDTIEWWWVKDMTDHTWEIRRLRRFKILFVELQRDRAHETQQSIAMIGLDEDAELPPVPVPDSEKDSAGFFMGLIDRYKGVDKLIASGAKAGSDASPD